MLAGATSETSSSVLNTKKLGILHCERTMVRMVFPSLSKFDTETETETELGGLGKLRSTTAQPADRFNNPPPPANVNL
jgi:hypothetical protein